MGAVTFSLDLKLLEELNKSCSFNFFVETGTFKGDTVDAVRSYFSNIRSIEMSPTLYKAAKERFNADDKINIFHGDSAEILGGMATELSKDSVLYWLDAHWCVADSTSGEKSQCPLLMEIQQIHDLNIDSVILIDDARLFLAPPPIPHDVAQWPSLHQVIESLKSISTQHEIMIVNDVIAFYPKTVKKAVIKYARDHGVDWLDAANCLKQNGSFLQQFEEKEKVIQELKQERKQYEGKDDLIQELKQERKQYEGKDDLIQELKQERKQYERKDDLIQELKQELKQYEGKDDLIQELKQELKQYEGKDDLIQELKQDIIEQGRVLTEKEGVIDELKVRKHSLLGVISKFSVRDELKDRRHSLLGVISKFSVRDELKDRRHSLLGVISKFPGARRMKEVISPRLGDLVQYAHLPRHIVKTKKVPLMTGELLPKISIVTPSFSQGDFIERTLLSVLEQDYPNLEYFVQDGGSEDNTQTILEQYDAKLSGWKLEQDSGQSQAINRGFNRSSGEIMAWLNSDDLLMPNTLAIVSQYFQMHPDIDVVYGNRLLIDENDMEIGRWILPGHDSAVLSWADYIPQETLFWRRSVWEKAGGEIDESFRFAMDWDLLTRFRNAGAKFAHIPEFLGAFRIHQAQKTSAQISDIGYKEMDRIRQRELGYLPSHSNIKKAVMPFLYRHIAVDLLFRIKRVLGINVY